MTLFASSGRAQPKNSYTISTGSGQPSSSLWNGRGWDTPVPRHATQGRGWQPRHLYPQEAHAHRQVCPLWSHHPILMKRGVVRHLHDRTREMITQDLQKEVDHLARVLKQNSYPANFILNASTPPTQETADTSSCDEEQEKERRTLVVIPYVAGMSKDIRCVCRKFKIRVAFSLGRLSAQC